MNIDRRSFLLGSAAAATLAGRAQGKAPLRQLKPGEKRTAAIIGCGGMNRGLMGQLLNNNIAPNVRVVAVCDCDRSRAAMFAKIVNKRYGDAKCRVSYDFRELVADPGIDLFCIATPDHWHAYIAVEAMKHGKDVYCEKPLTYSIEEAKQVMAAQTKYGRVLQTGSWQRSDRVFRDAVALVRGGLIGNVRYVDANYGRGGQKLGGPSHPVRFWDDPKNAAAESAPNPDVDWKMWLGPAKWRPYSDQLAPRGVNKFYPMFWRFDDDIGSGYNGDWGAHHLDIAQWGMDMDKSGPYKIIRSDEPYSDNLYHGGRRQFGMKMLFKKPDGTDIELYHGPFSTWGTVFYCTDGIVAVNRGKVAVWKGTGPVRPTPEIRKQLDDMSFMPDKVVAASVGKDYGTDAAAKQDNALDAAIAKLEKAFDLANAKVKLYKSDNQVLNFVECVLSREPTISPAEVGGRSCTLCLLCNMSYQYDKGFDWDPVNMDFANGTGAGMSLKREGDCNGWKVEV